MVRLKINDNVALKELENIGFKYESFSNKYRINFDDFGYNGDIYIDIKTRIIECDGEFSSTTGRQMLNIIGKLLDEHFIEIVEE